MYKTTNVDLKTDIHYGTIYANHVSGMALDDIIQSGEDLIYNEALETFINNAKSALFEFLESENLTHYDEKEDDIGVPDELIERFNDNYICDYSVYEYKSAGYHITYNNNDNSITILKSPYYCLCGYASPCFPNVGYLDSSGDVKTYCLGPAFFDEYNPLPYDVYEVSTDQLIAHRSNNEDE